MSKKHINDLRKALTSAKVSEDFIYDIITNLLFDNDLLIERTKFMLFYRDWKKGIHLVKSAKNLYNEALDYASDTKNNNNRIFKILSYYKNDLIDQLARESGEKIPYYGFNKFITMSCGVPRNLLNILKHTFRWSHFNDNILPFKNGRISQQSQLKGVYETADWFLEDNRIPGADAKLAYLSIDRIGTFLRDIRFSNIPPECSISIFSLDFERQTEYIGNILGFLEQYSFLIKVNSRRDKNSNNQSFTFQFNGIIAPKWELAISRRGTITLSQQELLAIFDVNGKLFEEALNDRLLKYNAPFSTQTSLKLF